MADITREQFDEDKGVVRKIFQKGRHLADADLNEQASIVQRHEQRLLSSLVNHVDKRFGEAFKVVQHADPLTVKIKAGFAAFHLDEKLATLLKLDNDYTLNGFEVWTQQRTDYIYVDIHEYEVGPSEDIDIVNPQVGEETCRDIRIDYEFKISTGTAPSSAPEEHIYRTIATVTRGPGSYIEEANISVNLPNHHVDLSVLPERLIWMHSSESHTSADAPALDASSERYIVTSSSGETGKRVIRIPYRYSDKVKYLAIYAEAWRDSAAQSAFLRLDSFLFGGFQIWIPKTKTKVIAHCIPQDAVDGEYYDISIHLRVTGTNVNVYMQRPIIVEGFGDYEIQSYGDT